VLDMIAGSVRRTGSLTRTLLVPAIGLAAAVSVGVGIGGAPKAVFLLVALLAMLPLVLSPLARLAFVVVGGMIVLNSSSELSLSKGIYAAGCIVAVSAALLRLPSLRDTAAFSEVRTLLRLSFLLALCVIAETVLAFAAGIPLADAVRDSSSYVLFACVPLLALDAATSVRHDLVVPIFVLVGTIATASYALQWIARRELAELTVERLTLAATLPAALFSYLSAGLLWRRRRWRLLWAVGAGGVLALLLVTGNRANLIFLLSPLAIVVMGHRERLRRLVTLAVVTPLVVVFAWVSFSYVVDALGVDTYRLAQRYETLAHPEELLYSQSAEIRLAGTRVAWEALRAHPWFGVGPGYSFTWVDPIDGTGRAGPHIDTPLLFPSKFGLVGLALVLAVAVGYGSLLRSLLRDPDIYRVAALGFAVSQVAWALVEASPIDSNGFTFGLLMLVAISLPHGRSLRPPGDLAAVTSSGGNG
jgi:hypothetical protein